MTLGGYWWLLMFVPFFLMYFILVLTKIRVETGGLAKYMYEIADVFLR